MAALWGLGGCATSPSRALTSAGSEPLWPQWGGLQRDFVVSDAELTTAWPDAGPPSLWRRSLGAGYSALVLADGRLYAHHRDGENEVVSAFDAASGEPLWSFDYPAPPGPVRAREYGEGPNATPLLADGKLITLGYTGWVHAFDAVDGELLWRRDLEAEGARPLRFGHSASPLEIDGAVFLLTGGRERGSLALELDDGSVRWTGPPKGVSYASPVLAGEGEARQLVYLSSEEVVALDPDDGVLLWTSPCRNGFGNNAADPVWLAPDRIWVASQGDSGARILRPPWSRPSEEPPSVSPIWHQPRASVHHWNAVRFGDRMITAIGGGGAFLAAIELATGEIVWRERGFPKARLLRAGELLVVLDENGVLSLARPEDEGLEVLAQAPILERPAWTVPTLAGGILYLRDQRSMLALDLRE